MKLSQVTKVEELKYSENVNQYLSLGWKLLDIYKTAADTFPPSSNHQTIHYVLGWLDGEPQYPPKDDWPLDDLI